MSRQQVKNLAVKLAIAHHRRRHKALFCYQFDQVFMIAFIYEISIQKLPLFRRHIIYNFLTQRMKHGTVRQPYNPCDLGHPAWLTLTCWQVTGRKRPCLVLVRSLRLRSWQSHLRCWWHPGDPIPGRQAEASNHFSLQLHGSKPNNLDARRASTFAWNQRHAKARLRARVISKVLIHLGFEGGIKFLWLWMAEISVVFNRVESVCLSVCLSVYLSINLSIHLSTYLPSYLPTYIHTYIYI